MKAIEKFRDGDCPREDCGRVASVDAKLAHDRRILFGEPDSDTGGLVGRVRTLESRMGLIVWTLAALATTALGSLGMIIAYTVTR
jgi:hypothetical protein